MNKKIIPAILEKKFLKINKLLTRVKKETNLNLVQIDICDGILTPTKTFANTFRIDSLSKLKKITAPQIKLELDLIVNFKKQPQKNIKKIFALQPERAIFHFQGVKDWEIIFSQRKKTKIALGIWLSDNSQKISTLLKKYPFDYIQIMGIEKVGFGGQKLSSKIFKKIKYFQKNFPNLPIQIDGGVKIENTYQLTKAGAIYLVSGSGFFGAKNLNQRTKEFIKNNFKV